MKERPILFSAPMVRALLAGTKTQTRRALRVQPPAGVESFCTYHHPKGMAHYGWDEEAKELMSWCAVCPYGQPGDRLWVRETWSHHVQAQSAARDEDGPFVYAADGPLALQSRLATKWTPGIHMFRWASRILLEITDVRVERLQDISEADAEAEGVDFLRHVPDADETLTAKQLYECLWDSINGADAWDANPWVWVVSFKRVML